jgi:uncharacterized membrane protein
MELAKQVTIWLATATEAVAGLVIGIAVLEAAARTLIVLFQDTCAGNPERSHAAKEEVRLRLGRWLALALEFELGADILRTAVAHLVGDRPARRHRRGADGAQPLPAEGNRHRGGAPGRPAAGYGPSSIAR